MIGIIAVLIGILLPALGVARQEARRVQCLSNLRQLATLATLYVNDNRGLYPPSTMYYEANGLGYSFDWDFLTVIGPGKTRTVFPGLIYAGRGSARIEQCPSFFGQSNTVADPFTGYNYNTSYIGHGDLDAVGNVVPPAKAASVRRPAQTALFGDGEYADGANKFMRAPQPNPGDALCSFRYAGTQGYRHRKATNVAYCDGHAESRRERFTENADGADKIAPGTGFLSDGNDAYGSP